MPRQTYPGLTQVKDPQLRQVLKALFDQVGALQQQATAIGQVNAPLADALDAADNSLRRLTDAVDEQDAVNLRTLKRYVQAALSAATQTPTTSSGGLGSGTSSGGTAGGGDQTTGLTCYTDLATAQPGGVPAAPNLRWWRGAFGSMELPGLPAVAGGGSSSGWLFTPFFDRYGPADQARILAEYATRGYTHFVLSWADSRTAGGVGSPGQSVAQYVATSQLVQANGFYPVHFLFSDEIDGHNPNPADIDAVVAGLQAVNTIPIACVSWEMDQANDPGPTTQALIDHVTGLLVPASNVYVHFSPGIVGWQSNGDTAAVFWAANVGKLTGILHQKDLGWDCGLWQAKLADLIVRFGDGVAGWPTDSGLGHSFDIVAYEYAASPRFQGSITENQAQTMGRQAISSPTQGGGSPTIPIKGFCDSGPIV